MPSAATFPIGTTSASWTRTPARWETRSSPSHSRKRVTRATTTTENFVRAEHLVDRALVAVPRVRRDAERDAVIRGARARLVAPGDGADVDLRRPGAAISDCSLAMRDGAAIRPRTKVAASGHWRVGARPIKARRVRRSRFDPGCNLAPSCL